MDAMETVEEIFHEPLFYLHQLSLTRNWMTTSAIRLGWDERRYVLKFESESTSKDLIHISALIRRLCLDRLVNGDTACAFYGNITGRFVIWKKARTKRERKVFCKNALPAATYLKDVPASRVIIAMKHIR